MNKEFYNMAMELMHIACFEDKYVEFSHIFYRPLLITAQKLIKMSIDASFETEYVDTFVILGEWNDTMRYLQETLRRVGFKVKIKKEIIKRMDWFNTPIKDTLHNFLISYEIDDQEQVEDRFELMDIK